MRIATLTLLLLTCVAGSTAQGEFAHPGVAHSRDSIEFVRDKVVAGEQPWATAWEGLNNSKFASLQWQPSPFLSVKRGPYNKPDIGSSDFSNDGRAAYTHAICWAISGEEQHAEKAAEIINAWSDMLQSIGDHDAQLLIGMSGYNFCVAAELLKHTWDKWPADNQAQFESMIRKIFYPTIKDFYPTANGNWDASMMQVMSAMGVFLDDQEMFDRATEYFLHGRGNGAIGNYFMESGQCQESGRDQAHTQMGLEFLANTCETAWIQGIDLYGALDNRLLKGFEYTAKYNLGLNVPYEPYQSFEGRYYYKDISRDSRGRLRVMYERVANHYQNRKGLPAPYTERAALKLRNYQFRLLAYGKESDRQRSVQKENDQKDSDRGQSDRDQRDRKQSEQQQSDLKRSEDVQSDREQSEDGKSERGQSKDEKSEEDGQISREQIVRKQSDRGQNDRERRRGRHRKFSPSFLDTLMYSATQATAK